MRRLLALGAVGLVLSGCTLEPHEAPPAPAIPTTWPTGPAYPPTSAEAAPPTLSYRDVFHDPHLQALIDRALANNQDLRATLANVEIARSQYRVQRSDLFPQVGANFTASRDHARPTAGAPAVTARGYQADVGLSTFEIDLFGRLQSLTHAAFEQYLASAEGAQAARLTLVGEVATAYFALAADLTELAVARETVDSANRTVALTTAQLKNGVAARLDVAQAQTLLDQARSDEQGRITQAAQDRNALELLVGGPIPDAMLPTSIESVDGMIGVVPAGLDSRILLRRPDVLEAEHTLRAANAQIGAARAAFFPTISLTSLAGFASPALGALFNHGNFVWQAQGGAALPIFTGGANVANLSLSKAQREQALAKYQSAIQSAFRDVADALARRGTMEAQLSAQTDLVAAANVSLTLQLARYREGIDPYLNVLVTQRTLYNAQLTQAVTRQIRADNFVAIYLALGADPVIAAMPTLPVAGERH
jgi:multidrug efflux system outer membrane protein